MGNPTDMPLAAPSPLAALDLGAGLRLDAPVVLAPMSGVTDLPFRRLAKQLGAHEILTAGRGQYEALCQRTGATMHQPEIGQPTVLGGFDLVFDCVGSARSLDDALRFTRARGRTVLVGMPAIPKTVDWTTIWFKELNVMGVYAYGVEAFGEERVKTFELALRFLRQGRADVRPLVTHRFPLTDYKRAIQTALATGPHRSVKTIFDLR